MDTDQSAQRVTTDTPSTEEVKKGRGGCGCWVLVLVVLVGGAALSAWLMGMIITREEKPLPGEQAITDLGLRFVAVPGEFTNRRNPSINDKAAAARGKELFGAECSICHGQAAKGDGPYGITMYPPAADLTATRVQSKTDGQLYWLVAHGINLSGMPAFGKDYGGPHDEQEIWDLITYVRSLGPGAP